MNELTDNETVIIALHLNCIRNYAIRKAIHNQFELIKKNNVWRVISNSCLDIMSIEWCKLFGSDNKLETTHWKNCSERRISDFKKEILNPLKISETQYKTIHKAILDYRNKNAAHTDLNDWKMDIPYFDQAIEIALLSYTHCAKHLNVQAKHLVDDKNLHYALTMEEIRKSTFKK